MRSYYLFELRVHQLSFVEEEQCCRTEHDSGRKVLSFWLSINSFHCQFISIFLQVLYSYLKVSNFVI